MQKNYPAARQAYQEALEIFRAMAPESEDVANCLNQVAQAEKYEGDYAGAERSYRTALHIQNKLGDRAGVAATTGNMAGLAIDRED